MMTRIRREEGGYVLVVVMLSMILVLALITGVMSYAVGSRDLSARDQDWNAALAAAEAGIDDYLFHLNQDGSYWQYSSTNLPPDGNQAFTTWVPIPGESSDASFRYSTSTSDLASTGTIKITATGKVGSVTRSVAASLRRRNFLDYLYFTDLETTDTALYPSPFNSNNSNWATLHRCDHRYYDGRDVSSRNDTAALGFSDNDSSANDYCTDITFISGDTVDGPLHTNDAIRISGSPHFNGDTSTSYKPASGNRWIGSGTPVFATAGDPRYADPLTIPPSNASIKNETNPTMGGTGCLFTGPTAISMNSDGTMDVISPFTRQVYCTWPGAPAAEVMFQKYTTTRFTLPTSGGGVVYVQNVPTAGDNATSGCPFSRPAIGGSGAPFRTHPLGFPQKNDVTPLDPNTTPTGYGCRNGDAFVQGTLHGRLTIAAENNIIVFGSTAYSGSTDLLGLVANNFINVYHAVADPNDPADFVASVNEIQTITLTSASFGDTFTLTYCTASASCQTTANISYSSTNSTTASRIATALANLAALGSGDISVTGSGSGSTRTYAVTFIGAQAATDVNPTMTGSHMSAPSCSGCSASVAESVKGVPGDPATVTTCDGTASSSNDHCNLKTPALGTTATVPSLFSGSVPGTSTMATLTGATSNRGPSISAALVTVAHSFGVQNYNLGRPFDDYSAAASLLSVNGAIAQKYRGPVGVFSGSSATSGYAKDYSYDQRLKYDSPPHFLDPVASAWQVVTWGEQSAEFPADAP